MTQPTDWLNEAQEYAAYLWEIAGGEQSRLRQPERVHLGNPYLDSTENMKVSVNGIEKCWVYPERGGYPTPDEEDDGREYVPGGPFLALLTPSVEKSLSPLKLGDPVWVEIVDGDLTITGSAGRAAVAYNQGAKSTGQGNPVKRVDLEWLLLRATNPPSRNILIGGGVVRVGDTFYNLPVLEVQDVITTPESGLSAGEALAVLYGMDATDNSVVTSTGSAFTDNRSTNGISDHAALFGDYPASLSSEDERGLGWVKIYAGMEVVTQEDIYLTLDPGDGGGGGGAPVDATYITQTANGTLTNEQALSSLATGAMQVTTSTGVITSLKSNIGASAAPTADDDSGDGYSVGSYWIDTTNDKAYVCLDNTSTAAVWTETTQAGSGSPNAPHWNAVGDSTINIDTADGETFFDLFFQVDSDSFVNADATHAELDSADLDGDYRVEVLITALNIGGTGPAKVGATLYLNTGQVATAYSFTDGSSSEMNVTHMHISSIQSLANGDYIRVSVTVPTSADNHIFTLAAFSGSRVGATP